MRDVQPAGEGAYDSFLVGPPRGGSSESMVSKIDMNGGNKRLAGVPQSLPVRTCGCLSKRIGLDRTCVGVPSAGRGFPERRPLADFEFP